MGMDMIGNGQDNALAMASETLEWWYRSYPPESCPVRKSEIPPGRWCRTLQNWNGSLVIGPEKGSW